MDAEYQQPTQASTSHKKQKAGKQESTMKRRITVLSLLIALTVMACTPTAAPTALPATATPLPTTVPTVAISTPAPAAATDTETVTDTEPITDTGAITTTATVTAAATVTGTDAGAAAGCPTPDDDHTLISSPAAGYCFLIPADFERSEFSDDAGFNLVIYGPASTPGHRERAFAAVTEATPEISEGRAEAVVGALLATMTMPADTLEQSTITLGGVPAIRIDNLPGQDVNRRLFAVHEGLVYDLTFVPFDETRPDAMAEAELLYETIIESFHFMPATDAASSYLPLLSWEGEIDGACHAMTIEANGNAAVGVCGDEPSVTSTISSDNLEWLAVQEHFGSISAETPAGVIAFQGQGTAEGDAWAQALATWARFTAMEINAGRAGASNRTTLAWQLTIEPEHSGLCSQLIVLAYGYAYANQIPCEGSGQTTQVATGWLSAVELDTFQQWVSEGARVESELGYLDAQGSVAVSADEISAWANAVYTRLLQ